MDFEVLIFKNKPIFAPIKYDIDVFVELRRKSGVWCEVQVDVHIIWNIISCVTLSPSCQLLFYVEDAFFGK